MVSDKMIEAALDKGEGAGDIYGNLSGDWIAKPIIQAAINAAWTRFDPDDEETWPKSEGRPSGGCWMTLVGGNRFAFQIFDVKNGHFELGSTVAYADPADLMPTWKDET